MSAGMLSGELLEALETAHEEGYIKLKRGRMGHYYVSVTRLGESALTIAEAERARTSGDGLVPRPRRDL